MGNQPFGLETAGSLVGEGPRGCTSANIISLPRSDKVAMPSWPLHLPLIYRGA